MAYKRIQNRIAESRFALPITAIYSIIVCIVCQLANNLMWIQTGCLVISTYMMVELNNANALIRIYSRMITCSFLVLIMAASIIFPSRDGAIVLLCFVAFYITIFHAYQDKRAAGWVFYAFFCLGLASSIFVQILFFVPILWILLALNILAMSGRTFWASVLGLIAPYWFIGGYYVYIGEYETFINHFWGLTDFHNLFVYNNLTEHQIITFAFVTILAVTGIIHFLRNSYNDKIRTRMIYETFITVDICTIIFLVLQPQHYNILMYIMIINTAPLIGHFIALTHTWITNIAFYVILIAALALTAYNLWMPSLIF